jgi:small-conductance mechanosensitive channel
MHRLFRLVLVCLALASPAVGGAMAQQPAAPAAAPQAATDAPAANPRSRLDALRTEIQQMEAVLAQRDLDDAQLQRLRQRADPVALELRGLVEELSPRAEQAKARLEQLGPKPDDKAPAESADIAAERRQREKALTEADEAARLSRALLVQSEQILSGVADRRRALFARTLFQRGPSLLSLELWGALLAALPQDVNALRLLVSDWFANLARRVVTPGFVLVLLAAVGAASLYVARARYLPAVMDRFGAEGEMPRLSRLLAAITRIAAGALPAAVASWLLYAGMQQAGLLPSRVEPFAWAVLSGIAFVAFIGALADATLAPKWPQRRVFGIADRNARLVKKLVTSAAIVLVAGKAVEALLQGIAAGLSLSIAARAGFALLFAGVLAYWLNQLRDTEAEQEACLGPYVPVDGAALAPLRLVGWALALTIGLSALLGYVALASFLVEQAAWILIVVTITGLALLIADEGGQALLAGGGRVSTALQTNVGLRRRSLEQAAVVGSGLLKLVLFIVAAMLILAPWGVESADLTSSLRAAFFGFKVGDVTISLSAIIIAGVLFALGLAATRALQRWLDERFLPATELDTGLRNSLKTMAGYVGFIAALALAISSLGLSLERLTIVAGALSVGIGFGLQSIVSNFVSGLILLWERPIRVGDLIVVGDGEGVVKRINVRSTEVETFDRSTVIVPNSNLISGVVKNRVRSDRTGRVVIQLSTPRAADPQSVRSILLEAATAHPDVQRDPPPRVFFKKINEATLDFDLICIVGEIDVSARVSSDLHFAIHSALAAEGIGQPEREVAVKGLDRIEDTLEELVDTMEEVQEQQAQSLAARRARTDAKAPMAASAEAKAPDAKASGAKASIAKPPAPARKAKEV